MGGYRMDWNTRFLDPLKNLAIAADSDDPVAETSYEYVIDQFNKTLKLRGHTAFVKSQPCRNGASSLVPIPPVSFTRVG